MITPQRSGGPFHGLSVGSQTPLARGIAGPGTLYDTAWESSTSNQPEERVSATFHCSQCGQLVSVNAEPGQEAQCGACGTSIVVPPPETEQGAPAAVGDAGATDSRPALPAQPLAYAPPSSKPSTGMAIASLVLGISGLVVCPPVGLVGLILGIIALMNANKKTGTHGGRGLAIAGISTGAISLLFVPLILLSILLPALSRARELAKRTVCVSNLHGIGQSLQIYANDNDGWFPPDLQTLVAEGLTAPKGLICPSSGTARGAPDFLYVPGLTDAATPNWIVAFDDAANHNGEGSVVLRVDGSATFLRKPQLSAELQRVRDEIDASEFAVHPWYRNFDW